MTARPPFLSQAPACSGACCSWSRFEIVEFTQIERHGPTVVVEDVRVPHAPGDVTVEVAVAAVYGLHPQIVRTHDGHHDFDLLGGEALGRFPRQRAAFVDRVENRPGA